MTAWVEGAVADTWPFLELVPSHQTGRFTLFWKETVVDPERGSMAVLRGRELEVSNPP